LPYSRVIWWKEIACYVCKLQLFVDTLLLVRSSWVFC